LGSWISEREPLERLRSRVFELPLLALTFQMLCFGGPEWSCSFLKAGDEKEPDSVLGADSNPSVRLAVPLLDSVLWLQLRSLISSNWESVRKVAGFTWLNIYSDSYDRSPQFYSVLLRENFSEVTYAPPKFRISKSVCAACDGRFKKLVTKCEHSAASS